MTGGVLMLQRWRESLRSKRFVRDVALLAGATAVAQLVSICVMPLLTRLYDPAQFGVLSVFTALLGTVGGIGGLKYELAIPLPRRDSAAANVLALSVVVAAMMSGIVLLLAVFAGHFLTVGASPFDTVVIRWLAPPGLLLYALYQSLSSWAVRRSDYNVLAKTRVRQSLGAAISKLGFGLFGFETFGLLLGQIVGQSGGIGSLGWSAWIRDRSALRRISVPRMRVLASTYQRYPRFLTGSSLLNSAGLYAPPALMAFLYGTREAGWLALAEQMTALPVTLIGGSVAQVYLGRAATLSTNPLELRALFLRTARHLAKIAIAPTVLAIVAAPWVFGTMFGAKWSESGVFVQLMSLALFGRFVVTPVAQNLNLLERQDLAMIWNGARLVTVAASFFIPAHLGLDVRYAVGAYAVTTTSLYAILMWMEYCALAAATTAQSSAKASPIATSSDVHPVDFGEANQ